MKKSHAFMVWVSVSLWALTGVQLLAQALVPDVTDLPKVVEIARQKDVVWLSLSTAIAAIGFAGWLVKQVLAVQVESIKAVNALTAEWAKRPCALKEPK